MPLQGLILLGHPVSEPSAFTAEALLTAVRDERGLSSALVPRICVLEFDGDLTDWLVASGYARPYTEWACFHTVMHAIEVDGTTCGIVARTIGGPYAVLVAEQLRASGAEIVLGLTSAGRVSGSLPLPSLVVVQNAIRDEGTSYHYLAPGNVVESDSILTEILESGVRFMALPAFRGTVWTTDAPFRETQQQLEAHAASGVLAVEMQAASLLAFSKASGTPVGIVAILSNAVDQTDENFNKGSHVLGKTLIESMCRSALRYLSRNSSVDSR